MSSARCATPADLPEPLRERVFRAVVDDGALVNNAATEEGGGSPARGAIPGTTAAAATPTARWRLTGEKTWTTWLPNLTYAFVTARSDGGSGRDPHRGRHVPRRPLGADGVERRPGFEAHGDARLGVRTARSRGSRRPDALVAAPARPAARSARCGARRLVRDGVAATYLGVGEGARTDVARWALDRRPGDGTTAVADVPSVQLRLGRLDADLRAAGSSCWTRPALGPAGHGDEAAPHAAADLPLAKLVATRRAVDGDRRGAADRRRPRVPGRPPGTAFRDARAGLINPPLEDVALAGFARAPCWTASGDDR